MTEQLEKLEERIKQLNGEKGIKKRGSMRGSTKEEKELFEELKKLEEQKATIT